MVFGQVLCSPNSKEMVHIMINAVSGVFNVFSCFHILTFRYIWPRGNSAGNAHFLIEKKLLSFYFPTFNPVMIIHRDMVTCILDYYIIL
jgi:hypothetical protein